MLTFSLFLCCATAQAAVVDEPVEITGRLIKATLEPDGGGSLSAFGLISSANAMAGDDGLIVEGFGVPNPYVPSRRLNEKLEVLEEYTDRPVIRYSYDCEGPNIDGLHVTRLMELYADEAAVRVTWTIVNNGKERQWVAPWVRSAITPGGKAGPEDRADVPTLDGIINAKDVLFHTASRNWCAVTDTTTKETFYNIFHAAHTHAFLIARDNDYPAIGVQASFVPRLMKPGDTWETKYRVGAVLGLAHVDFACEEMAAQVDYVQGKVVLLMAPAKSFPGMTIHPKITAENGRVWELQAKKFDLVPGKLVRATFDWQAPGDGEYNLVAAIKQNGKDYVLGAETGSPNGAIDTQVRVGKVSAPHMPAWTSAPTALELKGRALERPLLASGKVTAWAESPMFKVYRNDTATAKGANTSTIGIALAQNEHEARQIVIHPERGNSLFGARIEFGALTSDSGQTFSADNLSWREAGYVPVRIPTHYEGPTGLFPDPLLVRQETEIAGGISTPLWLSVHAPTGTPAGTYRGPIRLVANGMAPIEWTLELRVYGFELPATPALKTDFGLEPLANATLNDAYQRNALDHRVTLRPLNELPEATASLPSFLARAKESLKRGATTFAAPVEWGSDPAKLKQAEDAIKSSGLAGRVFVQLADTPPAEAWPRLLDDAKRWKANAPSIAPMITTAGISPFIPDGLDRWCVQVPVFDTGAGKHILEQIIGGREVWWYVDHMPPRPYANFFIDFMGAEHRMLFWQAWALGIRGVHYWNINYSQPGQDPYDDVSDATPVNGDGLLVYPSANGPVDSIRWELIRDGIEDYDYFALFTALRKRLTDKGGNDALLARAAQVYDLSALVPDLVTFSRDPAAIESKRNAIGEVLEEMTKAANTTR